MMRQNYVPVVSIIIPVKNAGLGFCETLSEIYAQEGVPSFEVIIIDSGSTDGTLELCRQFPVRLFQIPAAEFGHGRTRNLAASFTSATFLVFMVQDAVPSGHDWLRNLLAPMDDERVAGAYSRNLARASASRRQTAEIERYFLPKERLQILPRDNAFSNISSIIRKSVFDTIPFSAVEFGEDQIWARQVLVAGYKIKYQSSSCVVHSHDDGIRSAFLRGSQEGAFAKTIGGRPAHSSRFVVMAEALIEMLKWAIRADFKSCKYSLAMAAWHFGFLKGMRQK